MSTETNANDRRDESDADRTLDSWDDLDPFEDVLYVGGGGMPWYFNKPLTFKHGYANSDRVRVTTPGGFPHDLAEPASDFVRVEETDR